MLQLSFESFPCAAVSGRPARGVLRKAGLEVAAPSLPAAPPAPVAFHATSHRWLTVGAPKRVARSRLLTQLIYLALAERDRLSCGYCYPGQPCSSNHRSISVFDSPPVRFEKDLSDAGRARISDLNQVLADLRAELDTYALGRDEHGADFAYGTARARGDAISAVVDRERAAELAVYTLIAKGAVLLAPTASVGPYHLATDPAGLERFACLNLQGSPVAVGDPADPVEWKAARAAALFVAEVGVEAAMAAAERAKAALATAPAAC